MKWRRHRRIHEGDVESEVRDELAFHLEMRTEALRAGGLDEEAARREAGRRLGDLSHVQAQCEAEAVRRCRNRRLGEVVTSIVRDSAHAVRGLVRQPAFFMGACATLALGIGATTAVYSMVDAVLLAPLPYDDPGGLVVIRTVDGDLEELPLAREAKERIRAAGGAFASIAHYGHGSWILSGVDGEPEEIEVLRVEHTLFDVLGARPALGRTFGEEHRADGGAGDAVLLSWSLWQRRFGGDPSVVGRTIELRERPHEIIGVMPAGFEFPVGSNVQVWVPLIHAPIDDRLRHTPVWDAVARLGPNADVAQATSQASTIIAQVAETGTDDLGQPIMQGNGAGGAAADRAWTARVVPVREAMLVSDRALVLLLAAVGLLLVVACANVGTLFLVRGSQRRAELAVRAALGGSRLDLAMPAMMEVAIVCAVAAALGLLSAYWAVTMLAGLDPGDLPRWDGMAVNGRAWAAAALATAIAALLCVLAPARAAAQTSPADALRAGTWSTDSPIRLRLRDAIVAFEVGLVFVLLAGSGLLLRSFAEVRAVDTGYELESVLTARVVLSPSRYPRAGENRATVFYDNVLERLRAHPAVLTAAAVSAVPMSEGGWQMTGELTSPVTGVSAANGIRLFATPGWFETVGIPVRGRDFEAGDRLGAPRVTIFNESMARHMYPGQDALGQRFRSGPGEWEVIGIVPDIRYDGPERDPVPTAYAPQAQFGWLPGMVIAVRTRGPAAPFSRTLVDIIHAHDAALPVADVRTLDQNLSRVLTRRRFDSFILAAIAIAALGLAGVGVFSVTANAVAQRWHEFGIRQALGARAGNVVSLVLRRTLRIAAVGLIGGTLAALVLLRALRAVLFGVTPTDPLTFAVAACTVGVVALLAGLVPALRATRVDPAVTLRA
jgi:predicted permease